MDVSAQEQRRLQGLSRVLLFLLLLSILCAASWIAYSWNGGPLESAQTNQPATETAQLLREVETLSRKKNQQNLPVSGATALLLLVFLSAQLFSVIRAASIAARPRLSRLDAKRIELLCETPMYLGLLGSLMGVCLTQLMSGTLAAPLAYLTTISGIVLHLFARFMIALGPAAHFAGDKEE